MYHGMVLALLTLMSVLALFFSTLNYSLREFSRGRLNHWLQRHHQQHWQKWVVDTADELALITAVLRLSANAAILIFTLALFSDSTMPIWGQYIAAFVCTCVIAVLVSVAIPLAIARHGAELVIGVCLPVLGFVHIVMHPVVNLMHVIDRAVGRAAGVQTERQEQEDLQEQILSAVAEGQKEGAVDEQEREMIESIIELRDATTREVMTARADMVSLDIGSSLQEVKEVAEKTGHSRVPVYEQSLDRIVGVLYVRYLLQYVGRSDATFDIHTAMRPALFVPETKPLGDLLREFRLMKVHMAIVLDEYGGTAGLVTIEDVLEELVGEISDEHEPHEPAMLKRIDDRTWEADARVAITDANHALALNIVEDADYHTLGGYVSTAIGRIPEKGATLNTPAAKYIVIDAEPQRINRIRIELTSPESAL